MLSNRHLQVLACVGSSLPPQDTSVNARGLPSKLSHLLFQLRIPPRMVPFSSNEPATAPAPSHFCCSCSTPGFFPAILGVIIIPSWVSHGFEGRHKKRNKSFHSPTALICPWASWSFHPFAWVSPFSSSVPANSLSNPSFSPQVAKCLPCWGHGVSLQTADYSPNPVIYNLQSNTTPSNGQNIMLPLASPRRSPLQRRKYSFLTRSPTQSSRFAGSPGHWGLLWESCCLKLLTALHKYTQWRGYQHLSQGTQRPARYLEYFLYSHLEHYKFKGKKKMPLLHLSSTAKQKSARSRSYTWRAESCFATSPIMMLLSWYYPRAGNWCS